MLDTAYAVASLLSSSAALLVESLTRGLTTESVDRRIDAFTRGLLERARVDLHVHDREGIDWSRAYVILFNHQSHFDIPAVYQSVRGSMRMVAKKELFRVPIWGRAMRQAGIVRIDRGNRDAAIASLRAAGEQLVRGIHIGIAPEGTRSPDGRLGPLKKGGFMLARETGTPILPVAVQGTRDILAPHSARIHRGRRVDVWFGEPIPVTGKDTAALVAEVRAFLERHIAPSRPPAG